jgi:BirA family biotin operon repressor/biotin-[acetyl-CoA-carboxylase] ligase
MIKMPNLLDYNQIIAALDKSVIDKLNHLEVLAEVSSTNTWLSQYGDCGYVCLAEQQTAGRGRGNNIWVSPSASNIYLSLTWCLDGTQELEQNNLLIDCHFDDRRNLKVSKDFSSSLGTKGQARNDKQGNYFVPSPQSQWLGLEIGIALAQVLSEIGITGHGIKWPNDLFWQGKKIGGILIERNYQSHRFIIGIGINVNMSKIEDTAINQPWISLRQILGAPIDRNKLAALIISRLFKCLSIFPTRTFNELQKNWSQWDLLIGKAVIIHQHKNNKIKGVAKGIDPQGRLIVSLADGSQKTFSSADISVRW